MLSRSTTTKARDSRALRQDGGASWGDPTIIHQHATETAFAVDPRDPEHIIAATRLQRHALPGEDGEAIKRELSAVPYPAEMGWCGRQPPVLEKA